MRAEPGGDAMTTPPLRPDRRIQRTRQLLKQTSLEIIREKGFRAMSIQEITERANVNRGTFYAHFADKYALLNMISREEFHSLLEGTLPADPQWDRSTLHLLVQAVLDHSENLHAHRQLLNDVGALNDLGLLIDRAAQEELTDLLVGWLKRGRGRDTSWQVPAETIARVVSWVIFGMAAQWSQEMSTRAREQMINDVLLVIMKGVERLAPEALPE
jgi:AcrR family transcriptional regulator